MAFRRNHANPSRVSVEKIWASSNPEVSTGDDARHEADERTAEDCLIRQAINYLAKEGETDSTQTYANRVEYIEEYIIQLYGEMRHLFEPKLYRQLRSMVWGGQRGLKRFEEGNIDIAESANNDMEEVEPGEALYRNESDFEDIHKAAQELQLVVRNPQPNQATAAESNSDKGRAKQSGDVELNKHSKVSHPSSTMSSNIKPVEEPVPATAVRRLMPTTAPSRPALGRNAPNALVTEKEWLYGGAHNGVEV
ncbi:uncharacterized protein BDR25DRAFT_65251 [Lindgomyces ingoldianus]|uniref:Uncharacterized protein n=1 Tax=Lindgomyces ingoldianus TaxID=673940 RepID=A0ACB6RAI9_9PLEO|nr:uncharacterized protein BDR25DRAFT_65251 [Lindgomyces ingoldianus]KAF2476328.1 hypothetical protein BDR25DRAFT_65251 [Lindgomyces ingoldianus]